MALIWLATIPVARFLIFFNDWFFMNEIIKNRDAVFKGLPNSATESEKIKSAKARHWIERNTTEIKRRVEKAGIEDSIKSYMEPKGYGFVGQTQISILDNLLFPNSEIQAEAGGIIRTAKGYYSNQACRSLSPIYWIEVVFYLPKQIVIASGLSITSKAIQAIINIIQIIYWAAIIFAIIFKPELVKTIADLKP